MSDDKITIDVEGGCPQCKNPAMIVPENYTEDTIVTCPRCGYRAEWRHVYGAIDD